MCFKCHWVSQGNAVKLSTRELNQVSPKLRVCRSLGFVTYSSMRECYSLTNYPQNSDAFQRVEATAGNMAQKPGDNLFRKHRQSTEKWEKILKATSHVLYFGMFLQRNNNLSSIISKHFLLFSLNRLLMSLLSKNGPFRKKGFKQ